MVRIQPRRRVPKARTAHANLLVCPATGLVQPPRHQPGPGRQTPPVGNHVKFKRGNTRKRSWLPLAPDWSAGERLSRSPRRDRPCRFAGWGPSSCPARVEWPGRAQEPLRSVRRRGSHAGRVRRSGAYRSSGIRPLVLRRTSPATSDQNWKPSTLPFCRQ
jgi:hypothetical protein